MWDMHDVGWGWWLFMSVGMVGFWALVIYGVVWLARRATPSPDAGARPRYPAESPRQVLQRRLAAGEISVDEYERLRAVLDGDRSVSPPEPAAR
jgi:putative membrane protein